MIPSELSPLRATNEIKTPLIITFHSQNRPSNKKQYYRLLGTLLWSVVVAYFSPVGNAIANNRGIEANIHGKMPDLGYDFIYTIFGTHSKNPAHFLSSANDIVVFVMIFVTFLFVMIEMKAYRIIIIKRWVLMLNCIFTLRGITVMSTIYPLPPNCIQDNCQHITNVFNLPVLFLSKGQGTCYDYFFSGHTANTILCTLIVIYSTKLKSTMWALNLIIFISVAMALLEIFIILELQAHYSVDVASGIIITVMLWFLIDYQIKLQCGFFCWFEKYDEYPLLKSQNDVSS